ncbi:MULTISPECIES: S26 family signal peptidase [unclassified Acidiphilium]|uniref:S26 family signal peptidase n=1 Tax=unclassified Acidiphilium TaxID=2617493 RepID=UPI000BC69C1C|nr:MULTISPECIES: S26 family signal peptidase [unclassified Acidiphilium]MCW8309144.1 S26 family signal peptidase [Acidiphilium sp. PA]OZB27487.1 MAG: conjugal transfer protein TraF [Acidiphilium sp. 34-64-41]
MTHLHHPMRRVLGGGIAGLILMVASALHARPLIVWNSTASTPIGLWLVLSQSSRDHLRVGDFVLFWPDRRSANLFAKRDYLPLGVPLLKRIVATAGQTVCERHGQVWIEGRHVADALERDGRGRRLVAWSGCGPLPPGFVFVLIPSVPTSLDGRYFGPTPISSVIGRVTPLWTPGTHVP